MLVSFTKPATYNGIKTIYARALVKWDFETNVLKLQKERDGWAIIRPAESAIWSNTDNRVIVPAKPCKWFCTGLTLSQAKENATQLIQSGLYSD